MQNQKQNQKINKRKCKRRLRDVDTAFANTLPEAEELGKESSKGEKGSFFPVETNGDRTTNPSISRSLFPSYNFITTNCSTIILAGRRRLIGKVARNWSWISANKSVSEFRRLPRRSCRDKMGCLSRICKTKCWENWILRRRFGQRPNPDRPILVAHVNWAYVKIFGPGLQTPPNGSLSFRPVTMLKFELLTSIFNNLFFYTTFHFIYN